MGDKYYKPDTPFLLLYADKEGMVSYASFDTEQGLIDCMNEVKSYGDKIIKAIEIEKCRDIELK